LSDGLADGVRQIAESSGVGAEIDGAALPIDPDARRWFTSQGLDPLHEAISGGDDYELLFASGPRARSRLKAAAAAGLPFTRIGTCTRDRRIVLRGEGRDLPWPRGYGHFR
jgi:thiamine-monophosphate kinase